MCLRTTQLNHVTIHLGDYNCSVCTYSPAISSRVANCAVVTSQMINHVGTRVLIRWPNCLFAWLNVFFFVSLFRLSPNLIMIIIAVRKMMIALIS